MLIKKIFYCLVVVVTFLIFVNCSLATEVFNKFFKGGKVVKLPEPEKKGNISIEEAINRRKSVRNYKKQSLSIKQLSQIIWAAAGKKFDAVTGATRTFPSAGGIYPLNLYISVLDVKDVSNGIYKYIWQNHEIKLIRQGKFNSVLTNAALGQNSIKIAPFCLVFTAVYSKIGQRYGDRGKTRYVHMDVGHAAENVYLQVTAMGLGTVAIGAFNDKKTAEVLGIDLEEEIPVYIMPVGIPR